MNEERAKALVDKFVEIIREVALYGDHYMTVTNLKDEAVAIMTGTNTESNE